MRGLVPRIQAKKKHWIAGTSPAMTNERWFDAGSALRWGMLPAPRRHVPCVCVSPVGGPSIAVQPPSTSSAVPVM